jgi:hypothetical protein
MRGRIMDAGTVKRLRQFLTATLGALMFLVGGASLGYSAIASAQPGGSSSWDIQAYNDCMKISKNAYQCCVASGGIPRPGKTCISPLDVNRNPGPLDDLPVVGKLPGLGGVL